MRLLIPLLFAGGALLPAQSPEAPFLKSELIFPLEHWHNHGSSIVQLPDGELFATWYHGSGERRADDVIIEAARRPPSQSAWGPRFTLADTPGFPDCNPALLVDRKGRLWLIWPVILANEWHTALLKYRITSEYPVPGARPRWELSDNLLLIPRNFERRVHEALEPALRQTPPGEKAQYLKAILERSSDKHFARMGLMTRVHPTVLPSGRILVPLYSDGFDFSLVALSDDEGETWSSSEPIIGAGSVQPSIVRRKDGVLVAYMRDNGPPPKRVLVSYSEDDGVTWTVAADTDILNPGSGLEAIVLQDGTWAMVNNDTESGRHSLAVTLSDDEGKTWRSKACLERDTRAKGAGSFHYPSMIQAADGTLHVSYSYFLNHLPEGAPRKSIKHAHFNLAWVKHGGCQ